MQAISASIMVITEYVITETLHLYYPVRRLHYQSDVLHIHRESKKQDTKLFLSAKYCPIVNFFSLVYSTENLKIM